jgi:GAF domain-containing protein
MTFQVTAKVTAITLNNSLSETETFIGLPTFKDNIDYYNWVGFYFANQESKTLHLGPYVGAEDRSYCHPFRKGCGQVAVSNKNFVVPDVAAQDNYMLVALQ